jgi:succinate dehydrogenase / fumarate reductase flavoprotein subunit
MTTNELQTIEHDVLVIGAGGAGLRTAIECSAKGMNTGVICKSLLGKAHTAWPKAHGSGVGKCGCP